MKLLAEVEAEFHRELPLLRQKWKLIVAGVVLQYVHGVCSRIAHALHHPAPLLHDLGFIAVPELGERFFIASEVLFFVVFVPVLLWTFHPFYSRTKTVYTVTLWVQILTVLVLCQFLRVVSFLSTQLPAPAYHCREGLASAEFTIFSPLDVLKLNVMKGCGDLIFSSHMTFTLTFTLAYAKHGTVRALKVASFGLLLLQSFFILGCRKHYTVDVVMAWYIVPLVYVFVETKLGHIVGQVEQTDRPTTQLPIVKSPSQGNGNGRKQLFSFYSFTSDTKHEADDESALPRTRQDAQNCRHDMSRAWHLQGGNIRS